MTEHFRTTEPFDVNHHSGPNDLTVRDYEKTMNTLLDGLRKNILDIDTTPYPGADYRYISKKLEETLFKVKGFVSYKSTYYPENIDMYKELKEALGVSEVIMSKIRKDKYE